MSYTVRLGKQSGNTRIGRVQSKLRMKVLPQPANQNEDVWASHWCLYQTLERLSNFFIEPHHVKLGNDAMRALALAERVMGCKSEQLFEVGETQ